MGEQSPTDRPPEEDTKEKEHGGIIPARQWLTEEEQFAEDIFQKSSEGMENFGRQASLLRKVSILLRTNPNLDEDLQNALMEDVIKPFTYDAQNENREGEIAMNIAAYLHSIPLEKGK